MKSLTCSFFEIFSRLQTLKRTRFVKYLKSVNFLLEYHPVSDKDPKIETNQRNL